MRRAAFARRLLGHFVAALLLLLASLAIGMAGYMRFENLPAIDAFLDASMLLSGMGPVHPPETEEGKLFAGLFALYAGLVFIASAALLLAPIAHRILHHFNWDEK